MAVSVTNDKILINLDHFVKQYFINSNFEYLLGCLDGLRSQYPDHDLEITAAVQTPLSLPPFRAIIDTIADVSGLPQTRITIRTRDLDFHHPRARISILDDTEYHWLSRETTREISQLEFSLETDPRLFGALFGRASYPRLMLAHYLETRHPSQSYVTLLASLDHIRDCFWGLESQFREQILWAQSRSNPAESAEPECNRGSFNFPHNIRSWSRIWGKYHIEIIVETDYHNRFDWTEKTWKCLASGKPFITMSGAGTLEQMKHMGFLTFHPWIDESYDQESNAWRRLTMIQKEIDRLANLDKIQRQSVLDALASAAEHNQNLALERYV